MEIRVRRSRKDSENKISKALQKALGAELSKVSFERARDGKAKRGLTAGIIFEDVIDRRILKRVHEALLPVSRGKPVSVYPIT